MNKPIFITSVFGIFAALPAFAANVTGSGNECVVGTLGVDSGTANLEAQWSLNNYDCGAGKYFDKTTATCVTCTANSYCPGGTFTVEDLTNGLNACPTGYGLSAAGAGAQTDCYRTCTTSDVAHSTAVSGGYYYTDNNQCSATSCAAGWHVKEGLDLANNVPSSNAANSAYITDTGSTKIGGGHDMAYYGWTSSDTNRWGADFTGWGTIKGTAYCSAKSGDRHESNPSQPWSSTPQWGGDSADWTATESELTSASGEAEYCWCRVDEYRADGSDEWESVDASAWVFVYGYFSDASACAGGCAFHCANNANGTNSNSFFRPALFSVVQAQPSICEANIIDLDWNPTNGEAHTQNQCTYDGQITLPTEPSKTGYTFGGWSVVSGN